jgi:hypothetical protein
MPEGPPFFHYAGRATGQQALERAGLIDVRIEEVAMTWPIRSASTFLGYFREGGARIGEILRQLTPEAARKVEADVAAALAGYGDDIVPTAAVVFSGSKA